MIRFTSLFLFGVMLVTTGCWFRGEKVGFDDPRVVELFRAANREQRQERGFSQLETTGEITLNGRHVRRGDIELVISTPYSQRMIAYRKVKDEYVWIAELERQFGPKKYDGPDGEYREEVTIAFQKEPEVYVGGIQSFVTWIKYIGDDGRLILPYGKIELKDALPVISEWRKARK